MPPTSSEQVLQTPGKSGKVDPEQDETDKQVTADSDAVSEFQQRPPQPDGPTRSPAPGDDQKAEPRPVVPEPQGKEQRPDQVHPRQRQLPGASQARVQRVPRVKPKAAEHGAEVGRDVPADGCLGSYRHFP